MDIFEFFNTLLISDEQENSLSNPEILTNKHNIIVLKLIVFKSIDIDRLLDINIENYKVQYLINNSEVFFYISFLKRRLTYGKRFVILNIEAYTLLNNITFDSKKFTFIDYKSPKDMFTIECDFEVKSIFNPSTTNININELNKET